MLKIFETRHVSKCKKWEKKSFKNATTNRVFVQIHEAKKLRTLRTSIPSTDLSKENSPNIKPTFSVSKPLIHFNTTFEILP
jgi:hypothetical protein